MEELERIEKNIDIVTEIAILYMAVLSWGVFPLMLLMTSFSLARGWDTAVFFALDFGLGAFWFALLVYIALLSIGLYFAVKGVLLIGKITLQDALSITLDAFFIFLSSLASILFLKLMELV